MSETPAAAPGQLEGNMYLFQKPELLTKEQHGHLGLARPTKPFGFCADVRAIPLTISEIAVAQRHYPIIFSSIEAPMPMAVVGLIDEENLFVDDKGEWQAGAYIPGYIRRYPFALANDQSSERMAMIIDASYDGLSAKPDMTFFQGDKPSDATTKAMEYCQNYEQDRLITIEFGKRLGELGIITNQVGQFTPDNGEAQPFAQYNGIEEKALNELSDEKFLEVRKSNILPVLYAQLMSMGNWRTLMDLRARRHGLDAASVAAPVGNA